MNNNTTENTTTCTTGQEQGANGRRRTKIHILSGRDDVNHTAPPPPPPPIQQQHIIQHRTKAVIVPLTSINLNVNLREQYQHDDYDDLEEEGIEVLIDDDDSLLLLYDKYENNTDLDIENDPRRFDYYLGPDDENCGGRLKHLVDDMHWATTTETPSRRRVSLDDANDANAHANPAIEEENTLNTTCNDPKDNIDDTKHNNIIDPKENNRHPRTTFASQQEAARQKNSNATHPEDETNENDRVLVQQASGSSSSSGTKFQTIARMANCNNVQNTLNCVIFEHPTDNAGLHVPTSNVLFKGSKSSTTSTSSRNNNTSSSIMTDGGGGLAQLTSQLTEASLGAVQALQESIRSTINHVALFASDDEEEEEDLDEACSCLSDVSFEEDIDIDEDIDVDQSTATTRKARVFESPHENLKQRNNNPATTADTDDLLLLLLHGYDAVAVEEWVETGTIDPNNGFVRSYPKLVWRTTTRTRTRTRTRNHEHKHKYNHKQSSPRSVIPPPSMTMTMPMTTMKYEVDLMDIKSVECFHMDRHSHGITNMDNNNNNNISELLVDRGFAIVTAADDDLLLFLARTGVSRNLMICAIRTVIAKFIAHLVAGDQMGCSKFFVKGCVPCRYQEDDGDGGGVMSRDCWTPLVVKPSVMNDLAMKLLIA